MCVPLCLCAPHEHHISVWEDLPSMADGSSGLQAFLTAELSLQVPPPPKTHTLGSCTMISALMFWYKFVPTYSFSYSGKQFPIIFSWLFGNITPYTPIGLTSQSFCVHLLPCNFSSSKKKNSVLSIYSLEHGQIPSGQPLREDESFSACLCPRSHQQRRALR